MVRTTRILCLLVIFFFGPVAYSASTVQLKAGDVAPDFLGRDLEGNDIRLASYAGKVVVVSFFASWCAPCRKELPMLEKLQRAGADKGLQVIAVNWKEERQVFRQLVKLNPDYQLKFVSDARGKAGNAYGVKAIPYMFLIGKDGKIASVTLGYGESVIDKLIPTLNEAMNASAADPAPGN